MVKEINIPIANYFSVEKDKIFNVFFPFFNDEFFVDFTKK